MVPKSRVFFGLLIQVLFAGPLLFSCFPLAAEEPPQVDPSKVTAAYVGELTVVDEEKFLLREQLIVTNRDTVPLKIGKLFFQCTIDNGKTREHPMKEDKILIRAKEVPPYRTVVVYEERGFKARKNAKQEVIQLMFDSNAGKLSTNVITSSMGKYLGVDEAWLETVRAAPSNQVKEAGEAFNEISRKTRPVLPPRR